MPFCGDKKLLHLALTLSSLTLTPVRCGDAAKQGVHSLRWWKDSVREIERVIDEDGPFDGILGYSMGSAFAFALLAVLPPDTFRFAVLCCGYVPTNEPSIMAALEERRPLRTPALHCHGQQDRVIPKEYSDSMLTYFEPQCNQLLQHPGGHDIPQDAVHQAELATFLMNFADA